MHKGICKSGLFKGRIKNYWVALATGGLLAVMPLTAAQADGVPAPAVPTEQGIVDASWVPSCATDESAPGLFSYPQPQLTARVHGGAPQSPNLRADFTVDSRNADGTWTPVADQVQPSAGFMTDNTVVTTTLGTTLSAGTVYRMSAATWAYDTNAHTQYTASAATAFCYFTVDPTPPLVPKITYGGPYIACTTNDCSPHGGPGVTGTFTFTPAAGDSPVVGYWYRFSGDSTYTYVSGSSATVTFTPPYSTFEALDVEAQDALGRSSASATTEFKVGQGIAATATKLPSITGSAKVGGTLTATSGTWVPTATTHTFQWKANGTSIAGATATTYAVPASMYGKKITVTVTGAVTGYDTGTATSAAVTIAKGSAPKATKLPSITGSVKVGGTLTATSGTWSLASTTHTFQWKANGTSIAGATATTYAVPASMYGKKITVTVTGAVTGYDTGIATSAAVTIAKGSAPKATELPSITGSVKVGGTLTATSGTWSLASTTHTYQWKANGTSIAGATKSIYAVPASMYGKKITVTLTGAKSGYSTGIATSAAVTIAKGSAPKATKLPSITGTRKVASTLTATSGTWSLASTTHTYQWYANGKAIKGATKTSFKLTSAQRGTKITVRVTASRTGYAEGVATSASTATIVS